MSSRKRLRLDTDASSSREPTIFTQVSNLDEYRIKEMHDAEVYYMPSFIPTTTADMWYTELLGLDSWYQPTLKMYGREMVQSRKIAAYSTDPDLILKYSGQVVDMKYHYPAVLRQIQDQVEERLGVQFNHVMLNLYEDGQVYIGNHRDNKENKVIASVSLGAPRTFIMMRDSKVPPPLNSTSTSSSGKETKQQYEAVLKHSNKRKAQSDSTSADAIEDLPPVRLNRKAWTLDSGSLVVMQGDTQKYWKHEIPKEPKVKAGRISLTFRQLVSSGK